MNEEKRETEMKVAAMGGAGIPLRDIADQTGLSQRRVKVILTEKVEKNIDGLGDIYADFRASMRPLIEALVSKTLRKLNDKLDDKKVQVRDLIAVYHELAAASGLDGSGSGTHTQTAIARVDLKDPQMVKALREALVVERIEAEKQRAAVGDQT